MHNKAVLVADEDASLELKVQTYKYFKDIEKDNLDTEKLIKAFYEKYGKR